LEWRRREEEGRRKGGGREEGGSKPLKAITKTSKPLYNTDLQTVPANFGVIHLSTVSN
jgi:hypothetical protein